MRQRDPVLQLALLNLPMPVPNKVSSVQYVQETVYGRMKVQSFLPEFLGRRIAGAAVPVHLRTLESAGACSKLTQACPVHLKVPEEVILHKNRDRK